MNDKLLMLICTIVSLLCVVWAVCIKAYGMAVLLLLNALFSGYWARKMNTTRWK